ncbi:hypothetical protein GGQ04_003189 [Salinibacter ruber]|uniref:hypothetical protein n=1 Tax=Salinibacter ruber TaxID=146919 RepID=UPI0021670A85|nr:hypothetical protein [Salinibacter ruber]MCS4048032.1 hypothetical protein [Salinibacter ruber]
MAENALERQDYELALLNVDSAIENDSTNVKAHMMKARILREMADSPKYSWSLEEYKTIYRRVRKAQEAAVKFGPKRRSEVQSQRELTYMTQCSQGGGYRRDACKAMAQVYKGVGQAEKPKKRKERTEQSTEQSTDWETIASFNGSGQKNTRPFTVEASEWRVKYEAESTSGLGGTGHIFQVYMKEPGSDDPVGEIIANVANEERVAETSYLYQPGRYYFQVNSANGRWEIKVQVPAEQ